MQIPLRAQLGKGIFLVAAPNLRDPNFRQTVVLPVSMERKAPLAWS